MKFQNGLLKDESSHISETKVGGQVIVSLCTVFFFWVAFQHRKVSPPGWSCSWAFRQNIWVLFFNSSKSVPVLDKIKELAWQLHVSVTEREEQNSWEVTVIGLTWCWCDNWVSASLWQMQCVFPMAPAHLPKIPNPQYLHGNGSTSSCQELNEKTDASTKIPKTPKKSTKYQVCGSFVSPPKNTNAKNVCLIGSCTL